MTKGSVTGGISSALLPWAVAFGVILLAGAAFAPFLLWNRTLQGDVEDARTQLGKMETLLAEARLAPTAGDYARRLETWRPDYLGDGEDPVVVAQQQSRLRDVIAGYSADLRSVAALPARVVDGQVFLGLRLQLRGGMRNVQKIFYLIESDRPFLFVERAELRPDDSRGPESALGSSDPTSLFAEIDVYGAKWPIESAEVAPAAKPTTGH